MTASEGRTARAFRAFWPAPLASGALAWAAFPPLDLGFLAPLAFAVLLLSIRLRGGRRAGAQALVAGLVLFLPGLSWIAPLMVPGWIFVACWCAAFSGLFGWAIGRVLSRGASPVWTLAAAALHVFADLVRTVLATGFPWLLPGYTGWRNPVLLGSADLIGVHGATFAIVLVGACVAEAVARRLDVPGERLGVSLRSLGPAAALFAGLATWAFAKPGVLGAAGPTVLLLQANIAQVLKEDRRKDGSDSPTGGDFWRIHESLAEDGRAEAARRGVRVDLVVWPETMVPATALRPVPGRPLVARAWGMSGAPDLGVGRRVAAASAGAETLAGILTVAPGPLSWNTAVLLDAEGVVLGSQDKRHLTPGGEYIPLRRAIPFRERLEAALEEMAGFLPDLQAGEAAAVLVPKSGTARLGVLVCYESIFPELARDLSLAGADVLVNCSNYAWFAGTAQMEQALAMGAFRAAELRRPLVMSSNNGVSAVVGPDGRTRARLDADAPGFLLAAVPLGRGGGPFEAAGERAAWGLGAAGAVVSGLLARRRSSS